jgi:hypothetical protein
MAIDLMEIVDLAKMPDTINGTNIDPQATDRANLRKAIQALADAETKITSLEEAKERAQQARWALHLDDAEAALRRAQRDEPARVAEAFTNRSLSRSPLPAAQAAVDKVQAEYNRLLQIEDTIDTELELTHRRIERGRTALRVSLGEVVCGSAAFRQLMAAHTEIWGKLRGIRKAFKAIERAAMLPHGFVWDRSYHLDPDVKNEPMDETLFKAWTETLARLTTDADADLPDHI